MPASAEVCQRLAARRPITVLARSLPLRCIHADTTSLVATVPPCPSGLWRPALLARSGGAPCLFLVAHAGGLHRPHLLPTAEPPAARPHPPPRPAYVPPQERRDAADPPRAH